MTDVWMGMPWYAILLVVIFICLPLIFWGNWWSARRQYYSFPTYELALPSSDGKFIGAFLSLHGDATLAGFNDSEVALWKDRLTVEERWRKKPEWVIEK